MKHIIILVLAQLLIFLVPVSQMLAQVPADITARDYEAGNAAGREEASGYYGHLLWGIGGFAGGLFLLGPIGTAGVTVLSQAGEPAPSFATQLRVADSTQAYFAGFMDGYAKRVEKRDLTASIVGGAIGTAVLVTIVAAVFASMDHEFITIH